MSVFEKLSNPLFVRVTTFCVYNYYMVNIVNIYKKYSFFIVFESEKEGILYRNSVWLLKSVVSRWYLVFGL